MKLLHVLITLSLILNQNIYTQAPSALDTKKVVKIKSRKSSHRNDWRHVLGSKIHRFKEGSILVGLGIYIGKHYPQEVDIFIDKSKYNVQKIFNFGKTICIDTYQASYLKIKDCLHSKPQISDETSHAQANQSDDQNSKRSDD
jgi:hypothetical protein